jgi:hypothetical protein
MAGGWFTNPVTGCGPTNYQAPANYQPISGAYNGAIMGWSPPDNQPGASSLLGAFATGLIEGGGDPNPPNNYDFKTGLQSSGRALSFNNIQNFGLTTSFGGGIFEGAPLRSHCIPDYHTTKISSATEVLTGNQVITGRTINAGGKQLIFVTGDVRITGNIIYGPHNISDVPKFALVVRGDIYIEPAVSRLDGWYIAQPTSGTTKGVIWTCNNGQDPLPDSWIRNNCNNSLVVNGALTAKQINLSRIAGDVGNPAAAENFNFTSQMMLGGAFFKDQQQPSNNCRGCIHSLISLPPVF